MTVLDASASGSVCSPKRREKYKTDDGVYRTVINGEDTRQQALYVCIRVSGVFDARGCVLARLQQWRPSR